MVGSTQLQEERLGLDANDHPVLEHGNGLFAAVKNKLKCFDQVSQ